MTEQEPLDHEAEGRKLAVQLDAKAEAIEEALRRDPGNFGLRITLLSARRLADRFLAEFPEKTGGAQ